MQPKHFLILVFFFSFVSSFAQAPDIIITNGKIFTSDNQQLYTEAVAIRGNRIIARGANSVIMKLANAHTQRIDVQGRTVVPGFNDAHYHHNPYTKGYHIAYPQDGTELPWQQMKDSIKAAAAKLSAGTFIYSEMGMQVGTDTSINRSLLDELAPNNPVILHAEWGHVSYFNTAFMKALHIAETFPDLKGGWFGRIPGTSILNGRAYEHANNYLQRLLPTNDQLFQQSLKDLGRQALYFGITSIQNMCTGGLPEQFLKELAKAPIPIRFRLIRWGEIDEDDRLFIPAKNVKSTLPMVTVSGTKWLMDGTPIERNAAWSVAYKDQPGWKGHLNYTPGEINAIFADLSTRKDQPLFHVVGDVAVKTVLDEVNSSPAWRTRRVRLEHADGLLPEMIPDALKAKIIVVQNPAHLTLAALWPQRFDGKVLANAQSVKSLLEAGIPIAIGSDGPLNPYLNMMFACIHPYRPSEALTREQAVIAYTKGSAYAEFADDKGVIAPGKLADLAVLSADIFTIPLQALPSVHSVLTIVNGRVVYNELKN